MCGGSLSSPLNKSCCYNVDCWASIYTDNCLPPPSSVQQSSFYGYMGMLPKRYTQGVMTGESKYTQRLAHTFSLALAARLCHPPHLLHLLHHLRTLLRYGGGDHLAVPHLHQAADQR